MPAATSHEDEYQSRAHTLSWSSVANLPEYFLFNEASEKQLLGKLSSRCHKKLDSSYDACAYLSSSYQPGENCARMVSAPTRSRSPVLSRKSLPIDSRSTRKELKRPVNEINSPSYQLLEKLHQADGASARSHQASQQHSIKQHFNDHQFDFNDHLDASQYENLSPFNLQLLEDLSFAAGEQEYNLTTDPTPEDREQQTMGPIMLIYSDRYQPTAGISQQSLGSRSSHDPCDLIEAAQATNESSTQTKGRSQNEMRNSNTSFYTSRQVNYLDSSPEFLYSPMTSSQSYQHHNCLSLEELKVAQTSCSLCGCNWIEDHVSLDCPECDGYSMTRPCPNCDGKCDSIWSRNLDASHNRHRAMWTGRCYRRCPSNKSNKCASSKPTEPIDIRLGANKASSCGSASSHQSASSSSGDSDLETRIGISKANLS